MMDRALRLSLGYLLLNGALAFLAIRLYRIMRPHQNSVAEYLIALIVVFVVSLMVFSRHSHEAPQESNEAE